MAYLITGRAGSGKSAVCLELKRRGLPAYDADEVAGLASWIDLKSGLPTEVDYTKYVDYQQVGWNWDKMVLDEFLNTSPTAFLCGSASNQLLFHQKFRQVFILDLDAKIHRQRLESRKNSDYAKDSRQIREILLEQQELVDKAVALGAIRIPAAKPVGKVAAEIWSLADER